MSENTCIPRPEYPRPQMVRDNWLNLRRKKPSGRGARLYNRTQDEVELFLVGMYKEKGEIDVANLGDDLAKR